MIERNTFRDTSAQDRVVGSSSPRQRHRRQWLLFGGIGAAVLLVFSWLLSSWSAGSRSVDSARVRIAEVKRGDLVRDISADGRVIAINSPMLYAIAGGTVTLKVVSGDKVKKDQPLAEISSPELRSKLVQEKATLASLEGEAQRAVLDAQLARSTARKLLNQAAVERQAAVRDLERYQRAYDGGAVAQVYVAKAQDEVNKAEIGLAAAREDHSLLGRDAELDAHNKRLLADRQRTIVVETQRQVDALTLRAPFDGQVGQVLVAQRANVAINAPLLSVVDLAVFEVEIKVPESFARDLAIGMPAQLTSGAGAPYPGEVSVVSPEVVNGEVNARLRFSGQQPPGLRQNQRLSARILLDTRRNVLQVERGPFLEEGGGRYAWVMDGDTAVKRPIRIGVGSLNAVEILDGLKLGDRIVISGTTQFGDAGRISLN